MAAELTFQTWSTRHKRHINDRLQAIFKAEQRLARKATYNDAYIDLLSELATLVGRGGKRLRPLLCLLTYEAYGGKDNTVAIQLAIAQELLHSFLLIHDDIIDRDFRRWGGPNISGVYFERFSNGVPSPEAYHMAQSWALLAGDICLTLANRMIQNSGLSAEAGLAIQQRTGQTVVEVISGELSDCSAGLPASQPSVASTLSMYSRKTASYSFRLPLQTGARAAGVSSDEQSRLVELGEHLGIAYQLHDDVLGMFGDPALTGKPNLGDLREGKRTLLNLTTLERSASAAHEEFMALLGQADAGPADLDRAQEIVRSSGALDAIQKMAANHLQQASALVGTTTMTPTGRTHLQALINQLQDRVH